jgi:hypothetical protein
LGRCDALCAGVGRHVPPPPTSAALIVQFRQALAIFNGIVNSEPLRKLVAKLVKMPAYINYAQLKLHPTWNPLRANPHFEAIVGLEAPRKHHILTCVWLVISEPCSLYRSYSCDLDTSL